MTKTYKPETCWVGVQPTPHPKNVIKVAKPIGAVGRSIMDTAIKHGPTSAILIAEFLNLPVDSVRNRLALAAKQGKLKQEVKLHPNGRNRINYYSGVQ